MVVCNIHPDIFRLSFFLSLLSTYFTLNLIGEWPVKMIRLSFVAGEARN